MRFTMAESSFKNEYPQGMTQTEENNPHRTPMIVENGASIDIPDIGKKKKSPKKARKILAYVSPWPITYLDPFDFDAFRLALKTEIRGSPRRRIIRNQMNGHKDHSPCLDARYLRETHPNRIPVILKKDASSDIPDMNGEKFLVCGDMPIREFVDFIRITVGLIRRKSIFVFFKNTEPPTSALMSAIDEENKDEDGFLHITYSGESMHENSCGVRFTIAESRYKKNGPQGLGYTVTRPVTDLEARKRNGYKGCPPNLDAWYWRERRPSCIPLAVEKDARSDLPEIGSKKFIVYGDMPLGEFVDYIRFTIGVSREKPIYVFFKNTEPPAGALMVKIDKENKDEDGYLHITYS